MDAGVLVAGVSGVSQDPRLFDVADSRMEICLSLLSICCWAFLMCLSWGFSPFTQDVPKSANTYFVLLCDVEIGEAGRIGDGEESRRRY